MDTNDVLLIIIEAILAVALVLNSILLTSNLSTVTVLIESVLVVLFIGLLIVLADAPKQHKKEIRYNVETYDNTKTEALRKEMSSITEDLKNLNVDVTKIGQSIKQSKIESGDSVEALKKQIADMNKARPSVVREVIREKPIVKIVREAKKEPAKKRTVKKSSSKKSTEKKTAKPVKKKTKKKRKPMSEETKRKIAWKMERRKKYSATADTGAKPETGTRKKFWVPGYKKEDGTYMKGHWRVNAAYDPKKGKKK